MKIAKCDQKGTVEKNTFNKFSLSVIDSCYYNMPKSSTLFV